MKNLSIILLSTLLFWSALAEANRGLRNNNERLVIPMYGQHYRTAGSTETIRLKQLVRQEYGNINLRNAELKRVVVIAKSRRGRGRVSLVVGQDQSLDEIIGGTPRDFRIEDRFTYDRIVLRNPSFDSRGRWQLKIRGNIKIKRIVVVIENQRRRPRRQLEVTCYSKSGRGQIVDSIAAQGGTAVKMAPSGRGFWVISGCELGRGCSVKLNCFQDQETHHDFAREPLCRQNAHMVNAPGTYRRGKGRDLSYCTVTERFRRL